MTSLNEIKSALSTFDRDSFTKKDLVDLYELSLTTVRKTIVDCGLPISATSYSLDEVYVFHATRELVAQGVSASKHFPTNKRADAPPETNGHGYGDTQGQDTAFGLDTAVFVAANELVATSAEKVEQVMPALVQMHLAKMVSSPRFQESMTKMNAQMTARREGDVNDFLLQGMEMVGLLPPSMQRQQASLPQSDDY